MSTQQYCLRWNNHQPNFIAVFSSLLNSESLVDVTLAAEGRHLQAHKVVLSACSTYFQSLFTINPCQHPIVILKDVKFLDLKVIIDFMYYGEVNVSQGQLPHVLKTAAMLKIKGLADIPVEQQMIRPENNYLERAELLPPNDSNWCSEGLPRQTMSPSPCPVSPPNRRKRLRKISTSSVSGLTEKTEENQTIIDTLNASTCHMGTVIRSDNVIEKKHVIDGDKGNNHQLLDEKVGTMVSQNMNLQHTAENLTSPNVTGSTSGHNVAGIHWNVVDHSGYAQYPTSPIQNQILENQTLDRQCNLKQNNSNEANSSSNNARHQISNSPPQIMQKKKRSVNPQADENFVRALNAVRYEGIGFCKAARIYGVNNRTLWLEYKKRGYPNFRLSIKNRKAESNQTSNRGQMPKVEQVVTQTTQEVSNTVCLQTLQTQPIAYLSGTLYDGKHVDLNSLRPKYVDAAFINAQPGLTFQTINFEQM